MGVGGAIMQKLTKHNQGWIDRIVDQIIEDAQYFADNCDGNVNKKTNNVTPRIL